MASIQEQCAWLASTVGVFVTGDRLVRVGGDDAESWLNGQVTADVRSLAVGEALYALTVTVKGRVITDLWVARDPQGLVLSLPERGAELALAAFDKHIIMEDVELAPSQELRVLSMQGPAAAQLMASLDGLRGPGPASTAASVPHFACARLFPRPGFDLWVAQPELDAWLSQLERAAAALGGGQVEEAGLAQAHVVLGVPRTAIDFGADSYPQEAGLKTRAVSFSKGCYVGQEVVYMLEKRGQPARRLVQLECPAGELEAGDLVLDGEGKRLGELTSVAEPQPAGATSRLALAYLKRASTELGARVRVRDRECGVRWVVGHTDSSCPIVASA
jgi:folate-binding protein YgfZ